MSNVRVQAVFITPPSGTSYPLVFPPVLNLGVSEFQLDAEHRREVGVSVIDTDDGATCWVMRQGYLRNVDFSQTLGNTQVGAGDVIWADDSGLPTLSRPGPTKTRVKLAVVYRGNTFIDPNWQPDASIFVDVRVYPPLGEFTGVDTESSPPVIREVLTVVDHGSGILGWRNKPIRRSVDYSSDFTVDPEIYLARVDASRKSVV